MCNKVAPGSTTSKLALITVSDEGQSKWESQGKQYNTAITDIPIWEYRFLRGLQGLSWKTMGNLFLFLIEKVQAKHWCVWLRKDWNYA